MNSRRAFLKAAGGAALALAALGARAQAVREQARKPRVAPPSLVLGPERLAAMDERRIDVQALSVNADKDAILGGNLHRLLRLNA